MLHTVSSLILQLSLFLTTAVATHLVMSFGQTLLHYKVAHHPIGGKLFRNHINFHHTHYAEDQRRRASPGRCWPRAASKRAPVFAAAAYPLSSVCFVSANSCCWALHVRLVATRRATEGTHL